MIDSPLTEIFPEDEVITPERAMMKPKDLRKGDLVVAQIIAKNRLEFRRPFGNSCAVRAGKYCEDRAIFKNAA